MEEEKDITRGEEVSAGAGEELTPEVKEDAPEVKEEE